MQGNHRVFGATLDQLPSVQGKIYTPQQWLEFTDIPFSPNILRTNNPSIR